MTNLTLPKLQVADGTSRSQTLATQYRQLFLEAVLRPPIEKEVLALMQDWTSGDFFLAYGQNMDDYWYLLLGWIKFLSEQRQLKGVMPPIKGTIKQIKWAFHIRERCLSLEIEDADYSNPSAKYWIENWIKDWQYYVDYGEEPF